MMEGKFRYRNFPFFIFGQHHDILYFYGKYNENSRLLPIFAGNLNFAI